MFQSSKFENVIDRFNNNKMPHAILFYTNNLNYLYDDLTLLIKKILCVGNFNNMCDSGCNICRLIDQKSIPNIIEIEPDGLVIKKQQILDLKDKFSTKPIYSNYNIYLIKKCDALNASSANALLKFLEEPEDNILGFYATNNLEKVISTIKSRCEIIFINYDNKVNDIDIVDDKVNEFIDYVCSSNNLSMIYVDLFSSTDYDRKYFTIFFESLLYLFENSLVENNIFNSKFPKYKIPDVMILIKNTLSKIESNVNIELAVIIFAVELRNIYE